MDKLKDFIDTHRAAFDEAPTLPAGHEARFLNRLDEEAPVVTLRKQPRSKGLYLLYAASLAAAIALLLLLRFGGTELTATEDPFLTEMRQTATEMAELQTYYHMQMRTVREQMKQLAEQQPTPGVLAIWQESEQILADNLSFEQNELPLLPPEGETLQTLTQHYGNSLETLQFMLAQMERIEKDDQQIN